MAQPGAARRGGGAWTLLSLGAGRVKPSWAPCGDRQNPPRVKASISAVKAISVGAFLHPFGSEKLDDVPDVRRGEDAKKKKPALLGKVLENVLRQEIGVKDFKSSLSVPIAYSH